MVLVNQATVRKIAPDTWEYREVLHWKDKRKPQDTSGLGENREIVDSIKKALPPSLASDANARDIANTIIPTIWTIMFGPPEPLLSQLLFHPDLASHLLVQRLGNTMNDALRKKFGSRMTATQRLEVTRKILVPLANTVKHRTKASAGLSTGSGKSKQQNEGTEQKGQKGANRSKETTKDSGCLVALTFSVILPGKIVATNGKVNQVNGEVFWGLYPEAAMVGDVVLTATCKTNSKG